MKTNRFDRQIRWFQQAGQERVAQERVAIVGAGGVGSQVAQAVANAGFGTTGVIDHDILQDINLNRQAGGFQRDVGRYKADVVADHMRLIAPKSDVQSLTVNLRTREALEYLISCSLIFGCVDHDAPRMILSDLAAAYDIPLIDTATEIMLETDDQPFDFGGRVVVARPGVFCLYCANQIDTAIAKAELESDEVRKVRDAHGYGLGPEEPSPSVFALNGILANTAVMEALVMVAGTREPVRKITYKGMGKVMTNSKDVRKEDCYTCSVHGNREAANIWRYVLCDKQPEPQK